MVWVCLIGALGYAAYLFFPRALQGQAASAKKADKKGGKAAARPIPVSAVAAHTGDMAIYVTGLGSVTAYNTVQIRTRVDGELVKVAFREGQMVKAGDVVAQIDPRPYQVQVTQAEGAMARDQATLENARVDLKRYQVLVQQGAVTKQQVDTQAATIGQQEGIVKADQGAIDSAHLQLSYSRITAPISGRIGLRTVDQGNIVHASDANGLATVTQLQPISVIFNMPEDNLPQVQKAMRATHALRAEAYDRDLRNKLATGVLLTLDNQIDQTTGTVRVKMEFANRQNTLFPNQFVNAKLLVDTKRGVVIAPAASIQRGPQGTYVYVVKKDQTVEMRTVTTGSVEGDQIQIVKGVNPGEMLVTEGTDKLQQGIKVSLRKPGEKTGESGDNESETQGPKS